MAAVSSSSRRLTSTVALESATTTYMTHHSESGVIRNHSSDIVDRNVHNLPDFSAHHHSTSFHRVKNSKFSSRCRDSLRLHKPIFIKEFGLIFLQISGKLMRLVVILEPEMLM
jgi:hypothetical protein